MKKNKRRIRSDLIEELEDLRKEAARLREAETELRLFRSSMADSNPVGVYYLVKGKFQLINKHLERSTGYRADELIGQDSFMIVHPEDKERVRKDAIEMLKGKRTAPYEFR